MEPDLAVRLLRQGGHSGKQFAAYYARLESLEVFLELGDVGSWVGWSEWIWGEGGWNLDLEGMMRRE